MKKTSDLNNLEKKNQRAMILFVIGVILGVGATYLLSSNKTMRQHLYINTGILVSRLKIPNLNIVSLAIYIVFSLVIMALLTMIIRFFCSSRSLKLAGGIMRFLVSILLGIPISTVLFVKADKYVQGFSANAALQTAFYIISILIFIFFSSRESLTKNFISLVIQIAVETFVVRYFNLGITLKKYHGTAVMNIRIVILALIFAILFSQISGILGDMFYSLLSIPLHRCKLEIIKVVNDTDYAVSETVLKHRSFEDCFNAMKVNGERLWPTQFFRITETGWTGNEAMHWNYYANGEVIRMSKEEICKSFMRVAREAAGG